MFSTIMHPTDLSEASVPALKAAHELAGALKARLLICYIAHPPLVASGTQLTNPETGESRDILHEVRALQPFEAGVNSEVKIVTVSDAANAKSVLAILEQIGCDLLVLGMHKKHGLAGWLGGTITEDVVHRAHCAVMVVKHHDEPAEETSEEAVA